MFSGVYQAIHLTGSEAGVIIGGKASAKTALILSGWVCYFPGFEDMKNCRVRGAVGIWSWGKKCYAISG